MPLPQVSFDHPQTHVQRSFFCCLVISPAVPSCLVLCFHFLKSSPHTLTPHPPWPGNIISHLGRSFACPPPVSLVIIRWMCCYPMYTHNTPLSQQAGHPSILCCQTQPPLTPTFRIRSVGRQMDRDGVGNDRSRRRRRRPSSVPAPRITIAVAVGVVEGRVQRQSEDLELNCNSYPACPSFHYSRFFIFFI